jgi:hypothetical protein
MPTERRQKLPPLSWRWHATEILTLAGKVDEEVAVVEHEKSPNIFRRGFELATEWAKPASGTETF